MSRRKNIPSASSEDFAETEPPFVDPVVLPPQDFIDLHPFQPRDIPSVVEEFLQQCIEAEFFEVRLIHGRGVGVQRKIVRSILEKHPKVISFYDAPAEAGGWGATVVVLNDT
ncbi:MAG: Smr/MutS family protein [Deltaproteobacteria bacterium]|nr:Smr/MutS family protein [Deltaproteobacteria bacterium]